MLCMHMDEAEATWRYEKKVRHQQDAMRNLYGRRYWTRFQGEQLAFITQ